MNKNILVIDDNETMSDMLCTVLEDAGYAVKACVNGKDGIDAFRALHFDLVITDISMPVMGGIEVIKLVRQENATVPIIAMSGTDRAESFLGMADYYTADFTLQKPFGPKQLIKMVAKALEGN
jgi:CheY-like chemotaxis protein